ncbi:MAG: hypothetical protein RJA83_1532 [Pseudomonadota bacterium]|jgi:hypothetical protein
MEKFAQQKITELEKNLAKKIKNLRHAITTLPAYARRKKDKKNWETFFTVFAFSALVGIVICGTGGWLAVAVSGTLLALIIVESGLLLSLAIGFSAWPVYNIYLWTRDLFSSEKIKNQDKHYDQCQKNLLELKELAAEKNYLSEKIYIKLNYAIKRFPSAISTQGIADFVQLDLRDQIQRLEQKKKNYSTYSRIQKDKKNWGKVMQYSGMFSLIAVSIFFIGFVMLAAAPVTILSGPVFPVLVVTESILALLVVGPVAVSSFLHVSYLFARNLFSSAAIKAENKEYAQLEKTIAELKKLDKQDSQLDEKIQSKLQVGVDNNFVTAKDTNDFQLETNSAKNSGIYSENNNNYFNKYGPMFSENFPLADQAEPISECKPLQVNSVIS